MKASHTESNVFLLIMQGPPSNTETLWSDYMHVNYLVKRPNTASDKSNPGIDELEFL